MCAWIVRDVVIRSLSSGGYMLADAATGMPLGGPFRFLREAVTAAVQASHGGEIWQEHVDERSRSLGPRVRLPVRART
jgi:hypothetical protein